MRPNSIFRILLLLALPLSFYTQGSASSLQGKVVDVIDGERLMVLSSNQPLKVKLVGVAAPADSQPFSVEAKQHLAALVSGKYVVVHYTSLNHEGFVLGRVVTKDMDIGEQMIRDGVAWYDKTEGSSLSEIDKQGYYGSEQAARGESRGLWKDPAPLAPWEFRFQQAANSNLISKPQSLVMKAKGSRKSLSSEELFGSLTGSNRLGGTLFVEGDAGWKTLTPGATKFSVYVPGNAQEFSTAMPTASGQTAELNYSIGRRGRKFYLVFWGKGPDDGLTDDSVADEAANGLGFGLQRGMNLSDSGLGIEVKRQRAVRLGPYSGWQYKISGPTTSGIVRVFSKRVNQKREVYLMASLNASEDDPQVKEFLGSFTIDKY